MGAAHQQLDVCEASREKLSVHVFVTVSNVGILAAVIANLKSLPPEK